MCLFERNTARRGRSAVPAIFLRTRAWRCPRASYFLSAVGLLTVRTPSCTATDISGWKSPCSVAFGPLTVMWFPDRVTSTPCGIAIGLRPILLTSTSPHETENFAAGPIFLRLLVGHEAFRCRDDRDAKPSEHARQRVAL